jgi:hypothetical protein
LKEGPLYALGVTKEFFETEANVNLEIALEMEAQARCMQRPDFMEGYNDFIQSVRNDSTAEVNVCIET